MRRKLRHVLSHFIDLILNDEIGQRAAASDRVIPIDQALQPNATYQVSGEVTFDSTTTTKAQIASWGPPISKITVQAEYASSNDTMK